MPSLHSQGFHMQNKNKNKANTKDNTTTTNPPICDVQIQTNSIASLKRPVNLEIKHDAGDRSRCSSNGDDEAREAQHLQTNPSRAPPLYLLLRDVHLHREVDRERPEPKRPQNPHHVVEERQQHRDQRGEEHEDAPPHQPKHVEAAAAVLHEGDPDPHIPRHEPAVGPPCGRVLLHECKQRLAVDLVRAHQVDHDGCIGDVEEPERVVEPEPG